MAGDVIPRGGWVPGDPLSSCHKRSLQFLRPKVSAFAALVAGRVGHAVKIPCPILAAKLIGPLDLIELEVLPLSASRALDVVAVLASCQKLRPDRAGRDRWESLNALVLIVDEMPANATLADFANELDERQRSQHEPLRSAVTLSTIHAAKGLEWSEVYLIGLSEGYLPITYAKTELELAEERRLFYVGITRAKTQLWLSWNKPGQQSRFFSQLQGAN